MNWEDLIGVWKFPSPEEPSGYGWFMFTDDGRFFRAVYDDWQKKYVPMRMHVSVESPNELCFRGATNRGIGSGVTHGSWFVGDSLLLTNLSGAYVCTRVQQEEIPAWFLDELERAIASWPP